MLNAIENDGVFNESYFLYSNKRINNKDVFDAVAFSVKKRSFSDGDIVIKSNSEAQRDYALTILQTILSMTPIFDVAIPEVSVTLGLGIIASSMGISFDQLINGDTYEERRSAIPGLATNAALLGLSFAIPFLISKAGTNQKILSRYTKHEIRTLNETNIDMFLEEYGINKNSISETKVLEVELKGSGQHVNIVKLSDEDNKIVAVKGNSLSGIYYEVDIETGYEISSRRIYRTEYNDKIFWTRGGGLKGGNRSILKVSNSLYFSKMNHILQYRGLRYHLLMMIALFYILIRPQNYRNQRQKWRLLITLKELETLGRDL